MYKSAKSCR